MLRTEMRTSRRCFAGGSGANIHDTLRLKACIARGRVSVKFARASGHGADEIERPAPRDQAAGRSSTSTFGKSMSVSATLLV